jgi:hypothetical protein
VPLFNRLGLTLLSRLRLIARPQHLRRHLWFQVCRAYAIQPSTASGVALLSHVHRPHAYSSNANRGASSSNYDSNHLSAIQEQLALQLQMYALNNNCAAMRCYLPLRHSRQQDTILGRSCTRIGHWALGISVHLVCSLVPAMNPYH